MFKNGEFYKSNLNNNELALRISKEFPIHLEFKADLIDIETLHWHKFLALFRSLPEDSIIKQIISFRCYEPSDSKKKEKDVRMKWKNIWSLDNYKNREKNSELLSEINDEFYNS